MVASVTRRKVRGQCWGLTRISSANRWIARATVRVVSKGIFGVPPTERVKAVKGAERSCRCRRRKRGLRKGRVRSRVGKTRPITPIPAPSSKQPSGRQINRVLTSLDWYDKAADRVVQRFSVRDANSELFLTEYSDRQNQDIRVPNAKYRAFRRAWQSFQENAKKRPACRPQGCSFRKMLMARFGVEWFFGTRLNEGLFNPSRTLEDWLIELRARERRREQDPPSHQEPSRSDAARSQTRTAVARAPPFQGAPTVLTRGKPNGKRARPRELIESEPFCFTQPGGRTCCSHCGGPAFAWNQHRCAQAWRRQQGRGSGQRS